ncbi:MAG: hypothetical protein ACXWQO_18650 [Bdellovibrionota bacterium]
MKTILYLSLFAILPIQALAEIDHCKGWKHAPLLAEKAPALTHEEFSVDKKAPYKFAKVHYAHEKAQLKDGTEVAIEHRGCSDLEEQPVYQYSFTYTLKGKLPPPTDTSFWLSKAKTLMEKTEACKKENFRYDWCQLIGEAMKTKRTYTLDPSRPYLEGIDITHKIGDRGSDDGLAIKVKPIANGATLEVVNQLMGAGD